jgi:hypothetical protein
MAGLPLPLFAIAWAVLIIALLVCGVWVFFAIRRSFTPVLIFDLTYLLMLEVLCLSAMAAPANAAETAFYLITLVTFLLNSALTFVIFYEWGDRPARMNQYVWWLKIALSITGVYTILPLALYYLKLYYLPLHPDGVEKDRNHNPDGVAGGGFPGLISVQDPPEMMALPAELTDRYRNWRFLGWGGFGRVFSATKKDGTKVAIKLPRVPDTATGKSFITELQNWTDMDHENIVRVFDFNILPVPFFEMELCDGSLAQLKPPVDTVTAAELLYAVCGGLAYSHARGVVHRDLKPSNILLRDGVPKISDWGLSLVLSDIPVTTSLVAFSPQYAAPEQVAGGAKDERTDIWQAGVILYELITGSLPFTGETLLETMNAIVARDPKLPSHHIREAADLDGVVLRCLSRDPTGRYQHAEELQGALAGFLEREYTARLASAIAEKSETGAARYCSALLLMSLEKGDLTTAYRYSSELLNYADWRRRGAVQDLTHRILSAMDNCGEMREAVLRARELTREFREAAS